MPEKQDFTKHIIELRRESDVSKTTAQVGLRGGYPKISLVNSHDGSSAYCLMPGWLELVCLNGMQVSRNFAEIHVPHKGNVREKVIDAAYEVVREFPRIADQRGAMQAVTLKREEQLAFANAALAIRYGDAAPVQAEQVIRPSYREQADPSLWSTLQTVQGHLLRGGLRGRNSETNRRTSTREVKGIDQSVKLNRALWMLAEEMAKLKAAA
jgi:hypothetical protein